MKRIGLVMALMLLCSIALFAQKETRVEPVFPASVPGLIFIESEDAVATNFAGQPTMDYSSSGLRLLQLNREPQAIAPFFAEYTFMVEEGGTWSFWLGGTPPGPKSDLTPSYVSPLSWSLDEGPLVPLYREDVSVVENYSLSNYWAVVKSPVVLETGTHTLRIEVSERRRYDTRYYFMLDALFFLKSDSPASDGSLDHGLLPPLFPQNLADRSIDNPYSSIAEYEAFIQEDPKDRSAYIQLAKVYSLLGDHGNAIKILSRAKLVAGDDPLLTLLSAKNRLWSGDNDEGLRLFREYLATSSAKEPEWAEAAKVSAWLVRYQEALDLYRDAIALFPDNLNLQVNNGLTFLWAGRVKEGEAQLEATWKRANNDPKTIKDLASIFSVNGYDDKALETYNEAIRLYPDNLEFYLLAAKGYLTNNDSAGADAVLGQIRERFVDSERLSALLDAVKVNAGLKQAAIDRYLHRLRENPDDLDLRKELVRAYFWNGRLDDALAESMNILINKLYRVFLDLDRDLAETYRLLDVFSLYRTYLMVSEPGLKAGSAEVKKALENWKKAKTEWEGTRNAKDPTRKQKADEKLSAAEQALGSTLVKARTLQDSIAKNLAMLDSFKDASVEEIGLYSADAETLSTLGSWRWNREADLNDFALASAKGNSLAEYLETRILLLERKSRPALSATHPANLGGSKKSSVPGTASGASQAKTEEAAADEVPVEPAAAEVGQSTVQDAVQAGAGQEPAVQEPAALVAARIQAKLWNGEKLNPTTFADSALFAHGATLEEISAGFILPETGNGFFTEGDVEEAVALQQTFQELDLSILAHTAQLKTDTDGLYRRAAARLRLRIYQHDSETIEDRREMSEVYLKLTRYADAQVQLIRILDIAPGNISALFTLARALELGGDWSGAMNRYLQVYRTDPKFENIATSYNRLARNHADRFSSNLSSTIDTGRTTQQGRLDFAAGGTSMTAYSASWVMDDIRVHSSPDETKTESVGLQTMNTSILFRFNSLDLGLSGSLGGTLMTNVGLVDTDGTILSVADLPSSLALSPSAGAGVTWKHGPFGFFGNYAYERIKDTFLPSRSAYFQHSSDAGVSAYYNLPPNIIVRTASARLYGRMANVYSPDKEDPNTLYTGLVEGTAGFVLNTSPWTTLTLGGILSWEDSAKKMPKDEYYDYYAPSEVLIAKGGLQVASWMGTGSEWVLGLSGRLWGGHYAASANHEPKQSLNLETQLRAELSKGDIALFVELNGSQSGPYGVLPFSASEYWMAQVSVGASIGLPGYIIP